MSSIESCPRMVCFYGVACLAPCETSLTMLSWPATCFVHLTEEAAEMLSILTSLKGYSTNVDTFSLISVNFLSRMAGHMEKVLLKKAPLKVCLFLVRFSPIELMGREYIPLIQDHFRKSKLPHFQEREVTSFQFQGGPNPELKKELQWLFYGETKQELVIITKSSIAFQVTKYEHFEAFQKRFLELFNKFARITELLEAGVFEFLGLRYINAIEEHDWRTYLTSSYAGIVLPNDIIDHRFLGNFSSFAQVATHLSDEMVGNIIVKVLQNTQGILVPPDIAMIEAPVMQKDKLVTHLDIDHFVLLNSVKMTESLLVTLGRQLHQGCERVFFDALSEKAKKEWS